MDKTTEKLAGFATSLRYEDLSPETVRITGKLLIDTLGCAIGGYRSEPSRIARRLAAKETSVPPARVLGSGALTSIEAATFANSVMVRYLDFNDTYFSLEVGHPSDMIAAILAVADAHHSTGKDVLLAVATAYEVYAALSDVVSLWDKGWDHGYYLTFGTTAAVGQLLRLSKEQMGNAIALASAPNVATRQTRSGALTMWKGCAAAAATRAGVFAASLAQEGMLGPSAAFEGRHGVWDQVTGKFEMPAMGVAGKPFAVKRTGIKFFPTEYHSQVPLGLILKLREKVALDDIESIQVETYHFTFSEIGSEPAKWDPQTRETADHSLPYMLAAALSDGGISVSTFSEERIRDPKLRPLMNRIKVSENPEFERKFPSSMECRIEVVTKRGERHVEAGSYPKGSPKNPLTDVEVEQKFKALCQGIVAPDRCQSIIDAVWALEANRDIGKVLELIEIKD